MNADLLPLRVTRFWAPKRGHDRREYEDAFATGDRVGPRRFAVADGASESTYARRWARLLVGAYVRGALTAERWAGDLAPLQACWQAEAAAQARPLPWYAAEKVRRGAFAALAGLTLDPLGRWTALAIGDCCVAQVRDGILVTAFPIASAANFDHRPVLIGSNPACNERLAEHIRVADGDWTAGDTFLLLSDAIAAAVLRHAECCDGAVDGTLLGATDRAGLRAWLDEGRRDRAIRNDDVTVLRVRVAP